MVSHRLAQGNDMAPERLATRIREAIDHVQGRREQLVLVVGPAGSGKTAALLALERADNYPYRSLGLEVSQRLLAVPTRRRPYEAERVVVDVVAEAPGPVILLDNIELLFDRSLALHPLNLLQQHSRNVIVVAAWTGQVEAGLLTYAAPGHREYRRYPIDGTVVVDAQNDGEG